MSETVRILVNRGEPMVWPQRCPRCGSTKELIAVQSQPCREAYSLWLNRLTIETESVQITSFACAQHAWPNELGIAIWKKSGMMTLARGLVYLIAAFCVLSLFNVWRGVITWEYYNSSATRYLNAFAIIGGLVLWWGRRGAAVLPLRLDPDRDVAVIRFSDSGYARDFKRANARATHARLVEPPMFFQRPDFWKLVIVGLILLYLRR